MVALHFPAKIRNRLHHMKVIWKTANKVMEKFSPRENFTQSMTAYNSIVLLLITLNLRLFIIFS